MTGGRATHGKKRHSQVAVSMREGVECQQRGCTISLLAGSSNHIFFGIILKTIFKKEKKMRRISCRVQCWCVCAYVWGMEILRRMPPQRAPRNCATISQAAASQSIRPARVYVCRCVSSRRTSLRRKLLWTPSDMRNDTAPRAFKSSHSKQNSYEKQHTHTHQYSLLARILLLWHTTITSLLYYTPTHTINKHTRKLVRAHRSMRIRTNRSHYREHERDKHGESWNKKKTSDE